MEKRPALLANVFDEFVKHCMKYPQRVTPARLNKNGGALPVLMVAILLKTKVNTTEVNKG